MVRAAGRNGEARYSTRAPPQAVLLSAESRSWCMSDRAVEFVENWASENIHAGGEQPEGDNSRAKALAFQCLAAAGIAGIPQTEISETFDDLTAFMAGEIEEADTREAAPSEVEDEAAPSAAEDDE
jgi:hypothetical protein